MQIMSKFEKLLKIYLASVLIKSWSQVNGMFLCLGNGCSSVSAPFKEQLTDMEAGYPVILVGLADEWYDDIKYYTYHIC